MQLHIGTPSFAVLTMWTCLATSFLLHSDSLHAQQPDPISKGAWTYKNELPESVTFDYGTALTVKEIDQLSRCTSLTRVVMGYAGSDSECVEVEGDLLKLGRLKNLEQVHLGVDALNDDHLRFIALLPNLRTLEFNADNGYAPTQNVPICTDRCADHLRSAKTLRSLVIHDGRFTDKFVAKITQGLSDLEVLSVDSAELTDESLRLLAERSKKLKSLSIASDHFTAEGLRHLDKLTNLEERSVSSPALRKRNNPKEISKLLGTWEYVSATYEGKPVGVGKNETITLTKDSWTLRRNGKLISSSTWEIDSTRSPKWLTQFTSGGKVNFLDRWVYRVDEEQLVLCKSSWIDERRPKEFNSRKGDKQYWVILRRKDSEKRIDDVAEEGGDKAAFARQVSEKDVAAAHAWAREKLAASRATQLPTLRGNPSLPLARPITSLVLFNVSVTDDELKHLPAFPKLKQLALSGKGITDDGLKHLLTLQELERLSLSGTSLSDAGMKHLGKLQNLKILELAGVKLTGSGIRELASLPNLQDLSLIRSAIDDQALKDVAELKQLQELNLRKTKVSDEGLKHLAMMPELRELILQSTPITAEGLRHLAPCKSLRLVYCWGTNVTKEEIRQLKELMPNCEVDKVLIE